MKKTRLFFLVVAFVFATDLQAENDTQKSHNCSSEQNAHAHTNIERNKHSYTLKSAMEAFNVEDEHAITNLKNTVEVFIRNHPSLIGSDLHAHFDEGILKLVGHARHDDQIQHAKSIVKDTIGLDADVSNVVTGAKRIFSRLHYFITDYFNDAFTTAKVKSNLIANRGFLKSVKVSTKKGIVELDGHVPSLEDKEAIMHLVKNISYVEEVHNHLLVKDE